jgi:hypothetical protein
VATSTKAVVVAAVGARGSGKSGWVKAQLEDAQPPRLIVWDPMREYGGVAGCVPMSDLAGAIRAMDAARWRIAYQPPNATGMEDRFELLCVTIKTATRCVFVAEELAFVTTPSKAPPAWRELCLLGRHETHAEATIIGVSQRPASIDKDFFSCCDVIHCGRLAYTRDAAAVAPYVGIDHRELMTLPDLHYIERTPNQGEPVRGVFTFNNAPRKKVSAPPAPPKEESLRK